MKNLWLSVSCYLADEVKNSSYEGFFLFTTSNYKLIQLQVK